MKKILILFVVLLNQNIFSQDGWQWVNPKPAYESINSIQIISENLTYAVGDGGLIMKSIDRGQNWIVMERDSTINYSKIQFLNLNTGYLLGRVERGDNYDFIKKTEDGGLNWRILDIDVNKWYLDIYFVNENIGYAVGFNNFVIKTTNGGNSWDSTYFDFGQISYWMEKVEFTDSNNGFIQGSYYDQYYHYSKILKTTNGGLNWNYIINDTNNYYKYLHFINSTTGFLIKNREILKTTNSGVNWFQLRDMSNFLQFGTGAFKFIDEDNFYFTTDYYYGRNFFAKSSNSGLNWDVNIINTLYDLGCIDVYNDLLFAGGGFGSLLYSTSGGNEWLNYNFSYDEMSRSNFRNSNTFYIAGEFGKFYKTTDGGNNWNTKTLYNDTNQHSFPINVLFLNDNTGFYFGDNCRFYRTSDGGENWNRLIDSCTGSRYTSYNNLYFIDQFTGFLIGGKHEYGNHWSYFSKTTDAGLSWNEINTNNPLSGSNLYFANENLGYLSCYDGLWKTLNGGSNWFKFIDGLNFDKCYFKDPVNFYRIMNDSVYKSTNAGFNWFGVYNSDSYEIMQDLSFWGNTCYLLMENQTNEGYIKIAKSTDNGYNWQSNIIADRLDMHKIYFTDENTGYLMGAFGRILKTTNAGGSFDPPITPHRFFLYQNYPNPFNPETSIKYELPETGYTTLKLYDMMGREVKSIVNGIDTRGIHEVESSLSGLASGIYFVQLRQGPYVMSIKIALVK